MQISLSHSQSLDRTFTVVISEEERQVSLEEQLKKIAQKIKMPGFRPGKVPLNLIRDQIIGEATEKSIHALIAQACDQLVQENTLTLAERPEIDFISEDLTAGPLEFKVQVQTKPAVVMPDYSAISVEKLGVEPDEKYYEETIARILEDTYLVGTDNPIPAQMPFYFKGSITVFVNNKKNKDLSDKDCVFVFADGETDTHSSAALFFYPALSSQLFGKKAGDALTYEVAKSDESFYEKFPDFAGKTVRFEVQVDEVLENRQVSLEDFLTRVNPELKTVENLKAELKKGVNQGYAEAARLYSKKLLLDALFDQCVFDVSEKKVEEEFQAIWTQLQAELEKAKEAGDEDPTEGKTEDEMRDEYKKIALRRVRLGYLITEISTRERVHVSEEELRTAILRRAFSNMQYFQQIIAYYRDNPDASRQLVASIAEDKVIDLILSRVARPEIALTQEAFQEKIESVIPGYFDEESEELDGEDDAEITVEAQESVADSEVTEAVEEVAPAKKAGRKKKGE